MCSEQFEQQLKKKEGESKERRDKKRFDAFCFDWIHQVRTTQTQRNLSKKRNNIKSASQGKSIRKQTKKKPAI